MLAAREPSISHRTHNVSDFSHLRIVRGDLHVTLTYDGGDVARPGGSAFLMLNGETALQINPVRALCGRHDERAILLLKPGNNSLRLVANVFGGAAGPTRVRLWIESEGHGVLEFDGETDQAFANIDQTWRLVSP